MHSKAVCNGLNPVVDIKERARAPRLFADFRRINKEIRVLPMYIFLCIHPVYDDDGTSLFAIKKNEKINIDYDFNLRNY
jgi:hypothetical protein